MNEFESLKYNLIESLKDDLDEKFFKTIVNKNPDIYKQFNVTKYLSGEFSEYFFKNLISTFTIPEYNNLT